MREHEVPTHVQAEDRVLLWLTFPQIVALTAVCALAYGLYRYTPFGPAEVRIALAALFALAGFAAVAGRIRGRRLPLVAADLLRYALGARRFSGPPAELARSDPPAPAQPEEGNTAPLRLLVRRPRGRRQEGEHRNGRIPFRWRFGKRRQPAPEEALDERRAASREDRERRHGWKKPPRARLLEEFPGRGRHRADAPHHPAPDGGPRPGAGRRGLELGRDRVPAPAGGARAAAVRRVTDRHGRAGAGRPAGGHGPGSAGAGPRRPRGALAPLLRQRVPRGRGSARATTCPWTAPRPRSSSPGRTNWGRRARSASTGSGSPTRCPGRRVSSAACASSRSAGARAPIEGAVASSCVRTIGEAVSLQTVAGHADVTTTTLLAAEVTAVTGTLTVSSGARRADVAVVAGGETRFRLAVAAGERVHALAIRAALQAALRIPLPPLVQLSHRPQRIERLTETAGGDDPLLRRHGDRDGHHPQRGRGPSRSTP